jgi:hypothetical protein
MSVLTVSTRRYICRYSLLVQSGTCVCTHCQYKVVHMYVLTVSTKWYICIYSLLHDPPSCVDVSGEALFTKPRSVYCSAYTSTPVHPYSHTSVHLYIYTAAILTCFTSMLVHIFFCGLSLYSRISSVYRLHSFYR